MKKPLFIKDDLSFFYQYIVWEDESLSIELLEINLTENYIEVTNNKTLSILFQVKKQAVRILIKKLLSLLVFEKI